MSAGHRGNTKTLNTGILILTLQRCRGQKKDSFELENVSTDVSSEFSFYFFFFFKRKRH